MKNYTRMGEYLLHADSNESTVYQMTVNLEPKESGQSADDLLIKVYVLSGKNNYTKYTSNQEHQWPHNSWILAENHKKETEAKEF